MKAETVAEATNQDFVMPSAFDRTWQSFAQQINGYAIAEELGLDFHEWGEGCLKQYNETGQWDLNILELRLMLFYLQRSLYHTGWTYDEYDNEVDSLLLALSTATGQPYTSKDDVDKS